MANEMEGGWRSGRKLLLLPCVAAGLEGARHNFGQLFVETGMDGSQGGSVQMLFLVAGENGRFRGGKLLLLVADENRVGRLRSGKLLLLVAPGTENTAVTINR